MDEESSNPRLSLCHHLPLKRQVKGASLTQVPLVDMGLADTTPAPGKGEKGRESQKTLKGKPWKTRKNGAYGILWAYGPDI